MIFKERGVHDKAYLRTLFKKMNQEEIVVLFQMTTMCEGESNYLFNNGKLIERDSIKSAKLFGFKNRDDFQGLLTKFVKKGIIMTMLVYDSDEKFKSVIMLNPYIAISDELINSETIDFFQQPK